MSSVRDHLRRWQNAGLLDAATASAIAAYEAAAERRGEGLQPFRVGVQEAFVYLGLGIAGAGAALLLAVNWPDLAPAARFVALLLPALVATVAGLALRRVGRPDLVRGGTVAWLAASGLFAGAAGVGGAWADWSAGATIRVSGGALLTSGLVFWWLSRSSPQVLDLGAASFLLSLGLVWWDGDPGPEAPGLVMLGFGAVGLLATEAALLTPRLAGAIVFGTLAAAGGWIAGLGDDPGVFQVAPLVAGAGLVVASVSRNTLVYMVQGVGVIFLGLFVIITRNVNNPTLAGLSLVGLGLALVVVVTVLARTKLWRFGPALRGGHSSP